MKLIISHIFSIVVASSIVSSVNAQLSVSDYETEEIVTGKDPIASLTDVVNGAPSVNLRGTAGEGVEGWCQSYYLGSCGLFKPCCDNMGFKCVYPYGASKMDMMTGGKCTNSKCNNGKGCEPTLGCDCFAWKPACDTDAHGRKIKCSAGYKIELEEGEPCDDDDECDNDAMINFVNKKRYCVGCYKQHEVAPTANDGVEVACGHGNWRGRCVDRTNGNANYGHDMVAAMTCEMKATTDTSKKYETTAAVKSTNDRSLAITSDCVFADDLPPPPAAPPTPPPTPPATKPSCWGYAHKCDAWNKCCGDLYCTTSMLCNNKKSNGSRCGLGKECSSGTCKLFRCK